MRTNSNILFLACICAFIAVWSSQLFILDFLLDLFDNLLDHQLNLFPSFLTIFVSTLETKVLLAPCAPGIPFIHQAFSGRQLLSIALELCLSVFFIKLLAVFSQVLPDLTLFVLRQEGTRTRAPDELLETVKNMLL